MAKIISVHNFVFHVVQFSALVLDKSDKAWNLGMMTHFVKGKTFDTCSYEYSS